MRPGQCAALLLAALLLAGCAEVRRFLTDAGLSNPPAPAEAEADAAEMALLSAAARAERAVTELARLRAADGDAAAAELPVLVPPELRRPILLDRWNGPLSLLLRELAVEAGYAFSETGPAPVRPLLLDLGAPEPRSLLLLLRDAGVRAGTAATVTVDAHGRRILLEWTPGA